MALVSGGTSGIGLATARRLRQRYRLALGFARDEARALRIQAELGPLEEVRAFSLDVTDASCLERGYQEVLDHFGEPPEVLVNSAGVTRAPRFYAQGIPVEHCRELMNLFYFGPVRLVQKVLPSMYSRRRGAIVNVSSVSAGGGYQGVVGYAEPKAALECFTKNLAVEVIHRKVSLHCVSPALVRTPMTESQGLEKGINAPLGRWLEADEVAALIEAVLAQGLALTGRVVTLDGASALSKVALEFQK